MIYYNNPWKPAPFTYIKDAALARKIYEDGIEVVDFLDAGQLQQLKNLYNETHSIDDSKGGLFYGVYSQDLNYRNKVQQRVTEILTPSFEKYFENFKVMVNTFIVKVSGPKSEFFIHQDHTSIDEWKYSSLSIWIPLHDIDEKNGAMCVVKKSHHLFSPYRGITFPAPFEGIYSSIRKYLEPVYMREGQVAFFDNRILHNSQPNTSGKNRVVLVSGIFPREAKFIHCYRDTPETDIELIEQADDFLQKFLNFNIGAFDRPAMGKRIGLVKNEYPPISAEEFEILCEMKGIKPVNPDALNTEVDCNMIVEPVHQL